MIAVKINLDERGDTEMNILINPVSGGDPAI